MAHLKTLFLVVISLFAPIQSIIIAALVLTSVDMITGILAARKQGIPITSSAMKRTVGKIFLYELAIMISFIAEKYLLQGIMPVSKLVAGFIGATELKSVLENLDIINGSSLFASLVSKLAQSENRKL
jgi:hypothetical protein